MTTTLLDRSELQQVLHGRNGDAPLTLALIDIDHFKEINETFGQDFGDKVLRNLEHILCGSLPEGAQVARIGGDEYAAVLPDTHAENALILLEEVRNHLARTPAADGVAHKVNLSVGIATAPTHADDPDRLWRAADDALWRAKREGRGRVAIFVESKMTLKSNYYPKASLEKLSKLATNLARTEASLLREALDDLFAKYREML